MTDARLLRRHRAYFNGWAQAFGRHELLRDGEQGLRWLLGEGQLGLILDPTIRARLRGGDEQGLGGLLADELRAPAAQPAAPRPLRRLGVAITPLALVDVGSETLRFGRLTLRRCPAAVIDAVRNLLDQGTDLHLYETYHLMYPSGTRILTLSHRSPMGLVYRELAPALIRSAPVARPAAVQLPQAACA
ncbi:MAG: hypothetical protein LJE69_06645 [Thiohalocapsa sp.]|jgi:hypothetical protein|uniref:hypothetical protein n=1 Tax=Thiohalocapsa sp. TaxID=2497641 RepID=UPI0025F08B6C|nr:hypothetical protein [Thiohalocapsa sp.]MCG6940911.1 hypothetical protein [Thiohalocapsa sp.]